MRFQSKQYEAIKAQAVAKLGRRLTDMENARGFTLQDSRSSLERAKAMGRKPVPAAPESWADKERARLARDKQEAKLAKLPRNERLLAYMDEMADRETEPDADHPRLESILTIRDRIRFDPSREQADLDFATLVLDQHGAGMDTSVAAEMFDELVAQERRYIDGLKAVKLQRQQELLSELAALDADASTLPSDTNRYNLLRAAVQRGLPLPEGEHEAIAAAESTPAMQSFYAQKYTAEIDAYQASL